MAFLQIHLFYDVLDLAVHSYYVAVANAMSEGENLAGVV